MTSHVILPNYSRKRNWHTK